MFFAVDKLLMNSALRCSPARRFVLIAWLCSTCSAIAIPIVNSVDPTQGPPGTQVRINGHNFADVLQVKFNNTLADFTVLTGDQLVAIVPVDAVSGRIDVTGLSGTATAATLA